MTVIRQDLLILLPYDVNFHKSSAYNINQYKYMVYSNLLVIYFGRVRVGDARDVFQNLIKLSVSHTNSAGHECTL